MFGWGAALEAVKIEKQAVGEQTAFVSNRDLAYRRAVVSGYGAFIYPVMVLMTPFSCRYPLFSSRSFSIQDAMVPVSDV